LIGNGSESIPPNQEADWITQLVQTHVLDNWEAQDEPEHLKTIRDRLLKSDKDPHVLLGLYQQILRQYEISATASPEIEELLLSGLVVNQQGKLKVRNRIYVSIFDQTWVTKALASLSV
jgi:hypothetical protein